MFHLVKCHRLVNRGLARGPVCPIYGVGICLSAALLGSVRSFISLALLSMAVATAVELAVGFSTDRFLSLRLWDYRGGKGNILGYVCPKFSLAWGVACAVIIKLLPLLDPLISMLDTSLFKGVSFVIFILILTDERISMIKPMTRSKSA